MDSPCNCTCRPPEPCYLDRDRFLAYLGIPGTLFDLLCQSKLIPEPEVSQGRHRLWSSETALGVRLLLPWLIRQAEQP